MKRVYIRIILVATLVLSIVACRKESPNIMNPGDVLTLTTQEADPSVIFERFWDAMNTSYLFWDIDPTDWDAIYTKYMPKFKALDEIYYEESDEDLVEIDNYKDGGATTVMVAPSSVKTFEYFTEITANLIDHHYYFELFDIGVTCPSDEQIKSRDYYHVRNGDETFYIWTALHNNPNVSSVKKAQYDNDFVIYSAEIDGIALLSLSSFEITDIRDDSSISLVPSSGDTQFDSTLEEVLDNYFEITKSENFKGAILDLRNNGGGTNTDLNILFEDYINQDEYITFLQMRQKNGPGRLDYSPYLPVSLNGKSSEPTKSFPVVSLINLYSVSMSELSSLFIKEFNSKSIWIGERSFGGQSSLIDDSVFAGGQITTDYIHIYTASVMSSDVNKVNHEGVGLIPDIELLHNDVIDDLEAGTDRVMNRAIEYLNSL